jgi:hypothetical protein
MAGVGEARGDAVTLGDTKRWESVRYWCSNPLWCLAPLRRGFSLADDAPLAWSPFFSALDQPKLFRFLADLVFVPAEHPRRVRIRVPKIEGGSEVLNIHFRPRLTRIYVHARARPENRTRRAWAKGSARMLAHPSGPFLTAHNRLSGQCVGSSIPNLAAPARPSLIVSFRRDRASSRPKFPTAN